MREKIFAFFQKAIDEDKLHFSLYFCSLFFKLIVYCKNFLYDKAILKPKKFDVFIISIGNVVAGGVGKTPFVIYMAKLLLKKGYKIAIVSRGYGGDLKNRLVKNINPTVVGDEPAMMAKKLNCPVFVGKDKIKSIQQASKTCDIILLDDGFQRRKVKKDLDIVVLDANKPFSNLHFLPRGYLRDNPKRIKQADILVYNHWEGQDLDIRKAICVKPVISAIKGFSKITFKEKKIAIFCGIANPVYFAKLLKSFEIVNKHFFVDHAPISDAFLQEFAKKSKLLGAKALICTEKDFVKLKDKPVDLPIYYVDMDFEIVKGQKILDNIAYKKII